MNPDTCSLAVVSLKSLTTASQAQPPWVGIRDAVAEHLGVPHASVPVEEVRVGVAEFARLREEGRLWLKLQGRSAAELDSLPCGRLARGAGPGFAFFGVRS